jgi:hypothetical protein
MCDRWLVRDEDTVCFVPQGRWICPDVSNDENENAEGVFDPVRCPFEVP